MTSIEWLWEQIPVDYTCKRSAFEIFEQAKEMHKQETETLYTKEQVIEFTMNMISQYVHGNTNIWNRELLKESLKQSKKD